MHFKLNKNFKQMKKIFAIVLALMAFFLPSLAEDSKGNSNPKPITLESQPIDTKLDPTIHRAPMQINIEAWYEAALGTISINYAGETEGEVNLYCNGELVATSPDINSTFMLAESGFYTIEILTESWIATGTIEI